LPPRFRTRFTGTTGKIGERNEDDIYAPYLRDKALFQLLNLGIFFSGNREEAVGFNFSPSHHILHVHGNCIQRRCGIMSKFCPCNLPSFPIRVPTDKYTYLGRILLFLHYRYSFPLPIRNPCSYPFLPSFLPSPRPASCGTSRTGNCPQMEKLVKDIFWVLVLVLHVLKYTSRHNAHT